MTEEERFEESWKEAMKAGALKEWAQIIWEKARNKQDEPEKPKFRQNEIVQVEYSPGFNGFKLYKHTLPSFAQKLPPYILAATVAPPDAKWWAVDEDGYMRFHKAKPDTLTDEFHASRSGCMTHAGNILMVYCPVDDWTTAKGWIE